eukprot:4639550-Pyramimonas_sp.AAC.1
MMRRRRRARPAASQPPPPRGRVAKLKHMCVAALEGVEATELGAGPADSGEPCAFCGSCSDEVVVLCPLCLLCWHESCCASLRDSKDAAEELDSASRIVHESAASSGFDDLARALPGCMQHARVCALCQCLGLAHGRP